jgi:hypothetical protein
MSLWIMKWILFCFHCSYLLSIHLSFILNIGMRKLTRVTPQALGSVCRQHWICGI